MPQNIQEHVVPAPLRQVWNFEISVCSGRSYMKNYSYRPYHMDVVKGTVRSWELPFGSYHFITNKQSV